MEECGVSRKTVERTCVGIERGNCVCGRVGGHKGHCGPLPAGFGRKVGERVIWTEAAEAALRLGYDTMMSREDLTAVVREMTGVNLSWSAIRERAEKLGLRRSSEYRSAMGKKCGGRPRGSKNSTLYVRTKGSRPTKGVVVPEQIPEETVVPQAVVEGPKVSAAVSGSAGFSMSAMKEPVRPVHEFEVQAALTADAEQRTATLPALEITSKNPGVNRV